MAETKAPQSEEEFKAMLAASGGAAQFIRTAFAAGDDERDRGLETPEGIERFDDIVYGKDPAWQVLDVYRPKAAAGETLPVIVSVHGGGWVYGDKDTQLGHVFRFKVTNLSKRCSLICL